MISSLRIKHFPWTKFYRISWYDTPAEATIFAQFPHTFQNTKTEVGQMQGFMKGGYAERDNP